MWLNLKDPCVAFQGWLCSSFVLLLWKEELVPAVPCRVPSEGPSPFGSPGMGSWYFCLGLRVGIAKPCWWAASAADGAICSLGPHLGPRWVLHLRDSSLCCGFCALVISATVPPTPAGAGTWSDCLAWITSVCIFTCLNK